MEVLPKVTWNLSKLYCHIRKNGKADPQVLMELQKAPNQPNNIGKEQNCRIHTCNFKTYYKIAVIKTVLEFLLWLSQNEPTSMHEDVGLIPGLAQWVKGSSVAMTCGVGHRHGVDLVLQWLWHRQAAAEAPI